MPRTFLTARIDQLYRDAVEGLIGDLSKKATFDIVSDTEPSLCPNCIWDPVNKASSGKYNGTGPRAFTSRVCPVCQNKGKLTTEKKERIKAIVRWSKTKEKDAKTILPEGNEPIKYAHVKCKVLYYDKVMAAKHFVVDGRRYKMEDQPIKRGLQTYVMTEFVLLLDQ